MAKKTTFRIPSRDTDGGWAWIVLSASVAFEIASGALTSCTGILFVEFLEKYGASPSRTALVFSTHQISYSIAACVAGYLCDKIAMTLPVIIAAIVGAVSTAYSGFSPSLLGVILSLGVLNGSCRGFLEVTSISSVGRYFVKKRTFATSLAVSGASFGVLVVPLILRVAIDTYSVAFATAILGGLVLQGCVLGIALKPLVPTREVPHGKELNKLCSMELSKAELNYEIRNKQTGSCSKLLNEVSFLRNPPLIRIIAALQLSAVAFLSWYLFVTAYSEEIGLSKTDASIFASITGVAELISRPTLGAVINKADFNKPLTLSVYSSIAFLACVAFAFLPMVFEDDPNASFWSLALLSVIFGVTGGFFFVFEVPLIADVAHPEDLGRAVGTETLIVGLGLAVSPLGLNWIQEATESFRTAMWCSSLCYIPAVTFLLWNFVSQKKNQRKAVMISQTISTGMSSAHTSLSLQPYCEQVLVETIRDLPP